MMSCTFCGVDDVLDNSNAEQAHTRKNLKCRQCDDGRCLFCRRVAEADQRVRDAKNALRSALEERKRLEMEHNQRNDPVGGQMPVEITSRIFEFCAPVSQIVVYSLDFWDLQISTNKPQQFILGGVCQTWRRILWSNPQFWMDIIIQINQKTPISKITLIKEWLGRSADLPLLIEIAFQSGWQEKVDVAVVSRLMDPLIPILNSVAHRWVSFLARLPSRYQEQLRSIPVPNHALQNLALEPLVIEDEDNQYNGRFDLGVEVSPVRLLLSHYRLENIQLNWRNLTGFVGRYLKAFDCVEIIRRAPVLQDCTLELITPSREQLYSTNLVVNSSIKSFDIDEHSEVFFYLTLPSLEELTCGLSEGTFEESLSEFVSRSACPLSVAIFQQTSGDDDDLIEFLHLTPSLKSLELAVMEIGEDFLSYLGATAFTQRNSSNPTSFLPNLESFQFNAHRSFPWSGVAAMVPTTPTPPNTSKRPLQRINFITYAPDMNLELCIDRESLDTLLHWINTGIDLQIWEDDSIDMIQRSQTYYETGILELESEESDSEGEESGGEESEEEDIE